MDSLPRDCDSIIKQFQPANGQWELTDDNIQGIDFALDKSILHNYCRFINTTPIEVFEHLIETKGCDVNILDRSHLSPIHFAFMFFKPNMGDSVAILKYLLKQNSVDILTKAPRGRSLFEKACHNINTIPFDIFKLLIEIKNANVNTRDNNLFTVIHSALHSFQPNQGENLTILMFLLGQDVVDINFMTETGFTLLHVACQKINALPLDVFKFMVETKGANINLQDKFQNTPLCSLFQSIQLIQDGKVSILTYLLSQSNIDVEIKNITGNALLHLACNEINKLPLDVFKLLIETHGADVNAQNNDKDTPIHLAIRSFFREFGGDMTVLNYLLTQNDVNINLKGKSGFTLLHEAYNSINTLPFDVFKCLIDVKGADVNAQDEKRHLPLYHALCSFKPEHGGDISVLKYLIDQHDADLNTKDGNGCTLLHIACANILTLPLEIFKYLIETKGCDVNAFDNNKDTPLFCAFQPFLRDFYGDTSVLTYLLGQNSVNIHITDQSRCNLLHLACMNPFSSLDFDCEEEEKEFGQREADMFWYPIVQVIADGCLQKVLEENTV
jgi:ankyrin repeat protein